MEIRCEQPHARRCHAGDAVREVSDCQREAIVLDVERLAWISIGGSPGRLDREGKCREWNGQASRDAAHRRRITRSISAALVGASAERFSLPVGVTRIMSSIMIAIPNSGM